MTGDHLPKVYQVFATIFHKPSKEDQPGEVPWTDFLARYERHGLYAWEYLWLCLAIHTC